MSIFKRLLLLSLCLRMVLLYGQNYPVQVSLQLAPPYTPQLSALHSEPGRMGITLLNKDLATPLLSVYLQLKLEGPGITLQTRAGYRSTTPVLLTAGIPQMLGGAEIEDLLQPANLDFQGLDRNRFLQAGQLLPEGLWRFSVTAFSTDRALQVSNTGSISLGLFKHKPPLLNFPVDGARSGSQLPQYVLFQWTPRHYASPFAAGSIRYRLRLVELVPNNRNPNEAMQSTLLPLFETITEQTSYAYGPADPPLFPGRGYAWQVQALDVDGSDLFEQDGYSQVSSFVFGDACAAPQAFSLQADAGRSFTARWRGSTTEVSNAAYLLWYRQVGMPVWQTVMVADTMASVGGLLPNTTYEARVTRLCLGGESAPTGTLTITTTQEQGAWDAKSKSCGKPAPQFDLSNRKPLAALNAGESFTAADFTIKVLSAQGQNGEFSGSGLVLLPFTGKVPIPCTWESVSINADRRLISGSIRILQQPLVLSNLNLEKLSDRWRDLFGSNWNRTAYKRMEAAVLGVENTGDGRIRIRTATGEETLFGGKNTVITDPAGKRWYVSAGGKITGPEGPAEKPIVADDARGEGMPGSVLPDGSMVLFGPSQNNALAWDEYSIRNQTGGSTYDRMDGPPGGYMPGWKLLATGASEGITATLRKGKVKLHPDSTRFLRSDGVRVKSERINDSTWRLQVPGRLHLWSDAIWAVGSIVPKDSGQATGRRILGKVNLIAVDGRRVHVVLVPVGNAGGGVSATEVQKSIQPLLDRMGVQATVQVASALQVSGYDAAKDKIAVNRRLLNTAYGPELQRFVKAWEVKSRYPGRDTAVVFLTGPAADDTKGYMGLNNPCGFVFCGSSKPDAHTLAHELGHGLLVLEHPFGEDEGKAKSTLNLMDYSAPHGQSHFVQWKRIHDKEEVGNFMRGLRQKEEEGKYVTMNVEELKPWLNPDTTFTFIDPAGNYIKVPGSIKSAVFSTFDKIATDANQGYVPQTCHTPFGCLISFGIGDNGYTAHIVQDSFFAGYRSTVDGKGIYYTHRAHKVDSTRFAESGVAAFLAKEQGGFITLAGRFKSSLAGAKIGKPGNGVRVLAMPVVTGSAAGNYCGSAVKEWLSGLEVSGKFKQIGGAWSPPGGNKKLWYLDQEYSLERFIEEKLNDKATFNDFITVFAYLSLSDEKLNNLLDCIANKEIMTDSIFRRIFRRNKQGGYFNYKRYVLDLQDLLKKAGNNAGGIADLRGLINRNADGAAFAAFFADDKKYNRCVLRQLTTKERIAVFDKVCVDEDYWWVKTQNVLLDLLETRDTSGKELEVLYLQGFRKNGYKWLREVWANEDVLTSRHRQRVLYAFIELFTQIEAARRDRVTTRTNLYHDEKGLHEFTYPAGIKEYYMGLSDKEFHYDKFEELVGYGDGLSGEMLKDGRVNMYLSGAWRMRGAAQQSYIYQTGTVLQYNETHTEVYDDTLWPLELINVVPCGDYKSMDVFRPGEVTTLPVLLVYFLERQRQKALENERDAKFTRRVIQSAALVVFTVAVPFTGGTSLALANLALVSTDIVISEVDDNINEAWESMTEAERNQHKTGYSAWKTFHGGWNTMNSVVAVGSLATLARSGALALNRYARLLRVNARFNNFVKSGSSFFAAISKRTFGKSFKAFNQRMGKFVGWGASDEYLSQFIKSTGIKAVGSSDELLKIKASSWQGKGDYMGIDKWEIIEVPAGTKVYGGLPGQSEFYTFENVLIESNYFKDKFWASLQVKPHSSLGYRSIVGEYQIKKSIKVAVSITSANSKYGKGGAWQVYIDNFKDVLTKNIEINLK